MTRQLANYIAAAEFERIPADVIQRAKQLILDCIGCAFGGYETRAGKILIEFVESLGGKPESTVIVDGTMVPAKHAAFANSHIAALLDFDETWRNAGHPGSPIVFSAIAMAERQGASGKDLINAIVTSYEVTTRIIDAMFPSLSVWLKYVVSPFACADYFGPAVAAAKLLNLDEEGTYQTLNIAGTNSRIPLPIMKLPMPLTKCQQAWQAEHGITAAILAQRGFTGIYDVLDRDRGFWVAAGSDRVNYETMTSRLDEEWNTLDMQFKLQPCCRHIHPFIEVTLNLIEKEKIDLEDVEEITFKTHRYGANPPYDNTEPKDMVSAEFSIPYCVAIAVLGYEPGPDWFVEERYTDPKVLELMRKVRLRGDPEADEAFEIDSHHTITKVEIKVRGKTYTGRTEYARGDPERPMTEGEIKRKFHNLAARVVGKKQAEGIVKIIDSLEKLDEIKELTKLFAKR